MHFRQAVVDVVYADQALAVLGCGEAVVTGAVDRIIFDQTGIAFILLEGTEGTVRNRIADGIVNAAVVVCRVSEIVLSVVLNHEGTFCYPTHDGFPFFLRSQQPDFICFIHGQHIVAHLCAVDYVAVVKAYIIQIYLTIVINEEVAVDTVAFAEPALFLLI